MKYTITNRGDKLIINVIETNGWMQQPYLMLDGTLVYASSQRVAAQANTAANTVRKQS